MLRTLTLGIILVVLFSGCTSKEESPAKERLEFPITAQEALAIVESDPDARAFIDEYLRNESRRITRINLNYDISTGNYTWKVELVERECGCKFGSEEGLNMLRAEVDPVTGRIINLETQVGVKEEEVARERCMEGCHTAEEIASFTVEGG
ncbi:MAG: hypothetical protein GXO66_02455 [Euryarchaeota archaeon]|nr:hypothetical protein [Euryarchaeota archaeon]